MPMSDRVMEQETLEYQCLKCRELLSSVEVSVDWDAVRDMTINHIHEAHYHTGADGKRCGPVERILYE